MNTKDPTNQQTYLNINQNLKLVPLSTYNKTPNQSGSLSTINPTPHSTHRPSMFSSLVTTAVNLRHVVRQTEGLPAERTLLEDDGSWGLALGLRARVILLESGLDHEPLFCYALRYILSIERIYFKAFYME